MSVTINQFTVGNFDDIHDLVFEITDPNLDYVILGGPTANRIAAANPQRPSCTAEVLGVGFVIGEDGPTAGTMSTIRLFENDGVMLVIDGLAWPLTAYVDAFDADNAGVEDPYDALTFGLSVTYDASTVSGGVRFDQLRWCEQGTSAVVRIVLDQGGSAYLELVNFDLARLSDQYFFA